MPMPISGIADSLLKTHARATFLIREIISSTAPFIAFGRPQTRGFNHLQTCPVGLYSGEYVGKVKISIFGFLPTNSLIYRHT